MYWLGVTLLMKIQTPRGLRIHRSLLKLRKDITMTTSAQQGCWYAEILGVIIKVNGSYSTKHHMIHTHTQTLCSITTECNRLNKID